MGCLRIHFELIIVFHISFLLGKTLVSDVQKAHTKSLVSHVIPLQCHDNCL